jgi:hypothetical protein
MFQFVERMAVKRAALTLGIERPQTKRADLMFVVTCFVRQQTDKHRRNV